MGSGATTVDFAHLVKSGHHEMVIMDVVINCGVRDTSVSRRKLRFDKRKLQDSLVVAALKHELGKIPLSSRDIGQSSRNHIVNEAISEVLKQLHRWTRKPQGSTG